MKSSLSIKFVSFTIIQQCLVSFIYGKCPSTEILYPCVCADDNISCGGDMYYDLRLIFQLVSQSITNTDKHFKHFYLNNTRITELVLNVFHDLTFEYITIDNAFNLTKINTHAFISTNFYVKEFRLMNTPYGNVTEDNNIFNVLNSMVNIEFIDIRNTAITTIPLNAFTILNKLKNLYIHVNSQLKTIGNNAFYYLNNLNELTVGFNPIEYIPDYAFNIPNKGNQSMILWLRDMPFTNNSFTALTFSVLVPPVELRLNDIKYLDQNIFRVYLSNGNTIRFVDNVKLECDCRMHWIYENRARYENLVLNADCTEGKSLFSDAEKFISCDHI